MKRNLSEPVLTQRTYDTALKELSQSDPVLRRIVSKWGRPPFWTHPDGFAGIVLAILAQQVSLESALAAFTKLETALGGITPERFLTLASTELRAVGFSRQKAGYVHGIAKELVDGALDLGALGRMDDDQARSQLMQLNGIGPWTADAYLLFSLKRPDAWPSGDLALAKSIQELQGLESLPAWTEVDQMADRWRPWRAVAARILWHGYLSERGR
jgi:DNA-3-methyladenine glycosylase II